jgi:leucyl aminopeptidase
MQIAFNKVSFSEKGALVFFVGEDKKLPAHAGKIDKKINGAITKAIKAAKYAGKSGRFVPVYATEGISASVIVIAGLGKTKDITDDTFVSLGGNLTSFLNGIQVSEASAVVEDIPGKKLKVHEQAANLSYGVRLKSYDYDRYFTKREDDAKPSFKKLTVLSEEATKAQKAFADLDKVVDGVFWARDLVTTPPNDLNPESYAEKCKELKSLGIKVEVLGEKELKKLGAGSLLGVGQGSAFESKLVVMTWNGGKKKDNPIAFVGKGVTFDTGGISIKPSNGMEDMKYDMGGSAAVVGLMAALAGRKASVNVVGVIGLVENMPDGNAQRPSDVVKSMSGQTIEILNTDAEGRLVLADALWYTQEQFKPKFMVNLATLTGAIVVALADQYAGLFSNNDDLADRLSKSGEKSGEKLWRFPLTKEYDKMIDSKIADMKNIGDGRGAGSITAAQFLQRFVNDVPWAHLDIAGMAWTKKNQDVTPEGATGFGVRVLNQLVADYYEGK